MQRYGGHKEVNGHEICDHPPTHFDEARRFEQNVASVRSYSPIDHMVRKFQNLCNQFIVPPPS